MFTKTIHSKTLIKLLQTNDRIKFEFLAKIEKLS